MKLAHIVPSLAEQHGGPSRSVRALGEALARLGHEVELFATDPNIKSERREVTAAGLRVRVFRRDWPNRICPSRGLRLALQNTDAAILHHHSLWLRTLHYAAHSRCRLVLSPRGMMSAWAWRHHAWRKLLARCLVHPGAFARTHGWHATSNEEVREISTRGFRQPVCVAPNGVEVPSDLEQGRAREHWHALCPETVQRPVALFYSRFHRKKRIRELIDLWLKAAPANWLLLVAGIPQEYTVANLEDAVRRASGADRVRVFNSLQHPPPYAIARLFLLPSHNENFGLVIAEAMAHGVPVVVTDTTPWRDVSRHNLGWCVPWQNYGQALAEATSEPWEVLRNRGDRACEWTLREFSWHKSARTLADFYTELLGS